MGWTFGRRRRVWYTPPATREYARKVAIYAKQAREDWQDAHGLRWPHDARYALTLIIYTRGQRRPDTDNVLKNVKDALQGVLWGNDRYVIEEHVYSHEGHYQDAVEVIIEAIPRGPYTG